MFEDFTATTWVALAFGGFGCFIAALSFLSMAEIRAFVADWRVAFNAAYRELNRNKQEKRVHTLRPTHLKMSDGWSPQLDRKPLFPSVISPNEDGTYSDADERRTS